MLQHSEVILRADGALQPAKGLQPSVGRCCADGLKTASVARLCALCLVGCMTCASFEPCDLAHPLPAVFVATCRLSDQHDRCDACFCHSRLQGSLICE